MQTKNATSWTGIIGHTNQNISISSGLLRLVKNTARRRRKGVRKIEEANKITQKALEILTYFEPTYWAMENPQTGKMKEQPFMQHLPFNDLDYCKYGMPYRERTRIWNNITNWTPRPLCCRDCPSMHPKRAQRQHCGLHELYRIPAELIEEIVHAMH